ncbi:glycosyltransferase family 10 domain-containing protein [Pedobacter mucosus]|uniref:glycosyltransferase family 10 domain-containing protein n=1 Tax=Pedobacter mucosus TaxID=2895286 RepID=UPI001EE4D482|nr:glycosyltransferase family 10 [Pedobacter mucosus]UKT64391.1 glycosyltransferase family 10 [Pedobacter mucosus]
MKKKIFIKFQNGLTFKNGVDEILGDLIDEYEFTESQSPDFIIFGPYGDDIPRKGNYVRIGYYCECITPNLANCEWAFGVPREEEIKSPRYKRIQWHGLKPEVFIKNVDVEEELSKKTKFCNFLYSNPIPYREEFFRQLSKYKKIDAPGKSMNNMPAIDHQYQGDTWATKRQFLTPYKFTIAFESYTYPGYQTEKLYDAMRMNSIPIYCGDPKVDEIFNEKSFIKTSDYISPSNNSFKRFLEKNGQYTFKDYLPSTYDSFYYKVRRKLKTIGKIQKMNIELNNLDFTPLIDQIIDIDQNQELYINMLKEPWLEGNKISEDVSLANRWRTIFDL